jgi:hypothetical protein
MPILINEKPYDQGTRFKIAIEPQFKVLSSIDKNLGKREISYMDLNLLQHGFVIITDDGEEKIKSIRVPQKENRTAFYHMHIYKTSGISTKMDIIDSFRNSFVYSNFIGLVDDEQMLNASLITGHFASYPIDLFNSFKKKLHTFTLVRDPVERVISHYLYECRLSSSASKASIEDLYNFITNSRGVLKDLQTKNMTSSMDKEIANGVAKKFLEDKCSLNDAITQLGATSRFISPHTQEDKWKDHIEKFSLIGVVDNKKDFREQLYNLLNSEDYFQAPTPEYHINRNFVSTKDFIKTIPKDIIDKITSINQNDMAMYEYIKSVGVYNGK